MSNATQTTATATCQACKGTGVCPHCEGGEVERVIPYSGGDDGPDTETEECGECQGSAECEACAGTGHDFDECNCSGNEQDDPWCALHPKG